MVDVAQLVRASDCGSEGRGFEPHYPPRKNLHRSWRCRFSVFSGNDIEANPKMSATPSGAATMLFPIYREYYMKNGWVTTKVIQPRIA